MQIPCFVEPTTDEEFSMDTPIWRAPNKKPLMISELPGITRAEIDSSTRSIWRYAKSMPVKISNPITMGEGCTPLVSKEIDGLECNFKLEWFSPTGSFKDRGASVLISFLNQQGIRNVIEDSSGNGGAAIAAYGAAAGMDVTIFVPHYTQPAKIVQSKAYGAKVVLVPGKRIDTEAAAIRMSKSTFYASHNWHPMFLQGTKTLGYEIWEDLSFTLPDNIVIPASAGSNLLGCFMAFKELMSSGETDRMPRMFVSQPQNCAPLYHACHATTQKQFLPTVAEGTAITNPLRLQAMVNAIKETNGDVVTITENEIIQAARRLARSGIYAETTSSHVWAGVQKLVETGQIATTDKTVAILTGSGLKSPSVHE